jgi:hypothetical protein
MRSRQRGALILLGLLAIALAATIVLTPSRRTVVALSATNACKSNATGTWSDIAVGLSGTATPSAATVGIDTITLSGVNFQADVPATLLISGYNLGLLAVGANSIPVKGWVGIKGTNTSQGVQVLQFTSTVNTTITDPNGIPGSGDETATPLALNLSLGTTTWTPTGGNVSFAQAPPGSLPAIPAGQVAPGATTPLGGVYISAQVAGGLIKANFDCQGGTSAVGGASFTAATPGDFATVTVSSGGTTTSSVQGSSTSTTASTGSSTSTSSTSSSSTSTTARPATTSTSTTTTIPATTTTLAPTNGSATYSASCKNSVTPDLSTLSFDAAGTLPGSVVADAAFNLTKMKWRVTIPASVFQTGINLSLLTPGTPVTGTLDLAITSTNTQQTTQDSPKIPLSVPVSVGADGLALPSTVAFDVPDMNWTARSGKIDMSMYGANVTVKLTATLQVVFVCKPSTTGPFVTTTAAGVSTATTTTSTTTTTLVASGAAVPTTTVAAQSLVRTGPSGSIVVQVLAALLLLDLGYLALSLRRNPHRRPRHAR